MTGVWESWEGMEKEKEQLISKSHPPLACKWVTPVNKEYPSALTALYKVPHPLQWKLQCRFQTSHPSVLLNSPSYV